MAYTAHQVYISGAAVAVECASCGVTSTSGSWRRGWPVDGARHANLCNRCGQRWQKAGRPNSLTELRDAEERKARFGGGGSDSVGGIGSGVGSKRPAGMGPVTYAGQPAPAAGSGAAKRARLPIAVLPAVPFRARRITEETASPTSSADTLTPSHDRSQGTADALYFQSDPAAWALASSTGPLPTPPQQPQGQPGTGQHHQFVSYCIQKLSSGRANHAAFWLQDERGDSLLAVVGTDARLSGHFTYATTHAFMALQLAPALRCTNRTEVQNWLASFALAHQVAEGAVRLPELSADERKRLLNPEAPVWAKPNALVGSWQGVREESGRLTDGRHFKRFWLVGAGGETKLVVTGVDSIRKDRRYKYFAEEEMGGFAFENGREVMDWINYVLTRPTHAPIEAEQARAAQPLKEADLGSLIARLRAAAQQERLPPPGPARPAAAGAAQAGGSAGKAAGGGAAAAGRAGGSAAGSPYAASLAGKVRPVQTYQLLSSGRRGDSLSPAPSSPRLLQATVAAAAAPSAAAAGPSAMAAAVAAAAAAVPRPSLLPGTMCRPRLGLRCATCGLTEHSTEECPLAVVSPPSLIHTCADDGPFGAGWAHRTLSLLLHGGADKASPSSSGGGGGAGCSSMDLQQWQAPPSPQLLSKEQLQALLHAEASSMEPAAGSKPITPDVQHAFGHYPQLLTFVSSTPSPHTRDAFSRWADKLSSHISDCPPPLPTSLDETPVGGWSWTPTMEALAILQELASMQVNLSLLEGTGIIRAVAQLRTHSSGAIAAAAEGIVRGWRSCAVAALQHAFTAMEQRA